MLCPFCKSEIPDDAKKCKNCGEWVDPAYRTPQKAEEGFFSMLSETVLNILWFLFITAIVAIAVILFIQANSNGLFGD